MSGTSAECSRQRFLFPVVLRKRTSISPWHFVALKGYFQSQKCGLKNKKACPFRAVLPKFPIVTPVRTTHFSPSTLCASLPPHTIKGNSAQYYRQSEYYCPPETINLFNENTVLFSSSIKCSSNRSLILSLTPRLK